MPSIRRLTTILTLSLLAAGVSACANPAVSMSKTAPGSSSSVTIADSRQPSGTPVKAVASPYVVTASSGAPPTTIPKIGRNSTSGTSGTSGPNGLPALRPPSDGREIVVVASTDGQGLWVREQPGGKTLRSWPDGTPMLVVGEDAVAEDRLWRQVLTLDGQTGWAAADFLLPADEHALTGPLPDLSAPPRPTAPERGLQARVQSAESTPTPVPAPANTMPMPLAPTPRPTRQRVAFIGQGAQPTVSTVAAAAPAGATPTPQPTATRQPTATPIRGAAGTKSIDADAATLAVIATDRGMPVQIGNRPRAGMELMAVQVKVINRSSDPLAVYRGAFRLSLSDRSRVEPLAGGESPVPYSAAVAPGEELEAWLTFEVPTGTRVDELVWAPAWDIAYAVRL